MSTINQPIQFKTNQSQVNYNKRNTTPMSQSNTLDDDMFLLQAKEMQNVQKKAKNQDRWNKAGVVAQIGIAAGFLLTAAVSIFSFTKKGRALAAKAAAEAAVAASEATMKKSTEKITNILKFKTLDKNSLPNLESDSINPKSRNFIKMIKEGSQIDSAITKYAGADEIEQCVLFHGPSGTGKTFSAKVMAKELDSQYAEVDFPKIASPYVGQASKNIESVFKEISTQAEKEPNKKFLVAFNEIDSMLIPMEKAGNSQSYVLENRTAFLNGLDSIQKFKNVKIVGTTNADPTSGNLDLAALSRFGNIFKIELPIKKEIIASLKWHLKNCEAINKFDFFNKNKKELNNLADELVNRNFSQRDIEKLSKLAKTKFGIDIAKKQKPLEQQFDIKYLKEALKSKEFTTGSMDKKQEIPINPYTIPDKLVNDLSFWQKLKFLFGKLNI